ncbi:unnamed protein product, partial [Discosporangium mesarthrocarpum]
FLIVKGEGTRTCEGKRGGSELYCNGKGIAVEGILEVEFVVKVEVGEGWIQCKCLGLALGRLAGFRLGVLTAIVLMDALESRICALSLSSRCLSPSPNAIPHPNPNPNPNLLASSQEEVPTTGGPH